MAYYSRVEARPLFPRCLCRIDALANVDSSMEDTVPEPLRQCCTTSRAHKSNYIEEYLQGGHCFAHKRSRASEQKHIKRAW